MNPLAIGKLSKHINDFSGIFTTEQVDSLGQMFMDHENATTEQVVTVFIPHREGNELLDIGLKLFNENRIGQKDLNNGLLLIVATEEKKLRIIVGKGLELKYTQMLCREIVEKYLRPLLNKGKYKELLEEWQKIIVDIKRVKDSKEKSEVDQLVLGIIGLMAGILPVIAIGNIGGGVIYSIFLLSFICFITGIRKINTKQGVFILLIGCIFFGIMIDTSKKTICTDDYVCNQNVLGHDHSYKKGFSNSKGSSNYSSDSSKTDWASSNSSSSSDFGGGGGSSNGGGYGD